MATEMDRISCNQTGYAYDINDYVMYRKNGICRIVDIRTADLNGSDGRTYYVLQSVYDENIKIYVPVDSDLVSEMRNVFTAEEIDSIIEATEQSENKWVDDNKQRIQRFEQMFCEGDIIDILWLLKVLSIYKKKLDAQKKSLNVGDSRILVAAEKVVVDDFAFALGIEREEVIPYILERVEKIKET